MKTPKVNSSKEKNMAKETKEQQGQQSEKTVAATAEPEISGTRTPLALVSPPPAGSVGYQVFQPVAMTQERKDFLKRQFTPMGCSDLELDYFIAFCERTGMDPILKQAYLVSRNAKVKTTRNGQTFEEWVEKFEPMVSEAGMAAKADSLPDFRGMRDGVVYENDTFKINRVTGEITHESGHPAKRGRLVGAWASVIREGRVVPPSYFGFEEKAQYTKDGKLTKFWNAGGPSQLLKCARAEQWRQGWPGIFNGQFIPEEMREEIDVTPASEATVGARDTTDKLAERMRQTAQAQAEIKKDRPGAEPSPASKSTVDVVAEKPKETKADTKPTRAEQQARDSVQLEVQAAARMGNALGLDPNDPTQFMPEGSRPLEPDKKPEVAAPPADPAHRDHQTTDKLPHQVADEKKALAAAEGPVMIFGEHKGKPIRSLDGPTLLTELALGESKIPTLKTDAKSTAEQKIAKVRGCVDAIKAEMKKRDDAALGEAPEPGASDDELL